MQSIQSIPFWPFMIYAFLALMIVGIMIGLSYFLGERHQEKKTGEPYESGIPPTGDARIRFTSQFYIIAMFFVIFDLDAAFIITYAIAFRELGLAAYLGMVVFVLILFVVIIYEWRIGAFNFSPKGKKLLKFLDKAKYRTENHQHTINFFYK